jgi:hypothetical protein
MSRKIKPIEMKKILLIILLATIAIVSCKKDDNDVLSPEMLAGTEWRTDDNNTSVEFKSNTKVTYNYQDPRGMGYSDDGLYSIYGNNITLDFGDFIVNGVYEISSISFVHNGKTFVVKKQ